MGGAPVSATRALAAKLRGEHSTFVIVNLAVNLSVFVRSYITMQVLDYRALGLVAVLQSVVLLIGVLHLGILNGGYRLLCGARNGDADTINDLVYSFLGVLAVGATLVVGVALLFVSGSEANIVAMLGIGGGLASLVRTWMMSQMLAKGGLTLLNAINAITGLGALALMAFVLVNPLWTCLIASVAQPVLFVALAALLDRSLLPARFRIPRPTLALVLKVGFVLFLSGLLLQLNQQVERWYVTAFLGLDALGHLYLAFLFVSLFLLVPSSFDQIFLPRMVRAHEDRDTPMLHRLLRQFAWLAVGYGAAAALAVAVLAEPLTALLLPKYVPDLRYLYLIAPGLILFTLSNPLAIAFNVLIRYRTYYIAYGAGTVLTVTVLAGSALLNLRIGLDNVMILRSASYTLMAAILALGFLLLTREHRSFRFNPIGPL